MAVTTGGRVRTVTGAAVFAAFLLVLLFGNPAYIEWVNNHADPRDAGGYFLHELAWPAWSFSSDESLRNLIAGDVKAILLIALTGVFVSSLAGSQSAEARGRLGQVLAGWAGYMFAGAFAGLLAAFIQANASLLGAFAWAAAGAVYGLFTGWIVGLATFGARR
jgi:hypothetical protein